MINNLKITPYIVLAVLFIASCTAPNRVKHKVEHGRWIIKSDNDILKGRYRYGNEVGTWRLYTDGYLYRKERYKKDASYVKIYHPNGKLKSKGRTNTERSYSEIHWFYTGKWKYYDEHGDLIETRIYDNGKQVENPLANKDTL